MSPEISERSLEEAIEDGLLRHGPDAYVGDGSTAREALPPRWGDNPPGGFRKRRPEDYDRTLCLLPRDVVDFVLATQPKEWQRLTQHHGAGVQEQFLKRLASEIERRGTLDVLRNGIKDSGCKFRLAFFRPASGLNEETRRLHAANLFAVVRQLRYTTKNESSLDLVLALNGIPIFTAELKNPLTGQSVEDAIRQYRTARDPREPLLAHGRCLAHFAVDPDLFYVTTRLVGRATPFLPFNQGRFGGAGNPHASPTHQGYATAYLWEETWARDSVLDLVRQVIHEVEEEDDKGRKTGKRFLIFPRYQQLDCVRRLVTDARGVGAGHRYLIQHSAGSGKSFTIAWLAHQLSTLHDASDRRVFDSIVVITDRRVLDRQLQRTVRQFEQTLGVVENIDTTCSVAVCSGQSAAFHPGMPCSPDADQPAPGLPGFRRGGRALTDTCSFLPNQSLHASRHRGNPVRPARQRPSRHTTSRQLKDALESGKTIIVTTLQKFPVIAQEIGELPGKRFAVIVDEAHSSQSGESTQSVRDVLRTSSLEEAETEDREAGPDDEDRLNALAEARKWPSNTSLFAFTATPKPKTLELFGRKRGDGKFEPFHLYTMRQAIEERFILDVLASYTTYTAYWRLLKKIKADPRYDKKKAEYLLKSFVELHPHAIGEKVRICVEHFAAQVQGEIGGRAKAMIVTRSRLHAVRFKLAVDKYLAERGYTFKALVAFSGSVEDGGRSYTEAGMNGFPETQTAMAFERPEDRFLIVANKFQTGFDQPLLHTMYVDKKLGGVNAVQTLSRLNRTHPAKNDRMVLDFANNADDIKAAFEPYYETTLLSEATDPNLLYEIQGRLATFPVYTQVDVGAFAKVYLDPKATQDRLYAVLAPVVARSRELSAEERNDFRGQLTDFVRLYAFLSQVLTFADPDLEALYQFARHLRRLVPADRAELPREVQQNIDMESYRVQQTGSGKIALERRPGILDPVATKASHETPPEELEALSRIIAELNERFGLKLGACRRNGKARAQGACEPQARREEAGDAPPSPPTSNAAFGRSSRPGGRGARRGLQGRRQSQGWRVGATRPIGLRLCAHPATPLRPPGYGGVGRSAALPRLGRRGASPSARRLASRPTAPVTRAVPLSPTGS